MTPTVKPPIPTPAYKTLRTRWGKLVAVWSASTTASGQRVVGKLEAYAR